MGEKGERFFQDRQHLGQGIDANERTAADGSDTADIGREIDDLTHNFVRPVETQIIGDFA